MRLKNNIISDKSGGVIILVAVMFGVLMSVLGIAVDVGRIYAVQSKLQSAADAALMGAVATSSQSPVAAETLRLFNANFPAGYMGTTISGPTVTQVSAGQYTVAVTASVPSSIMQLFGTGTVTLNTQSRVNFGYQLGNPQSLELALVFDNSTGTNINGERDAGIRLRNLIFGSSNSLPNVRFNIIPFDVDVDVGNNRVGWIQNAFVARYNLYRTLAGGGRGFISNRNGDNPITTHNDFSDVAPTTDATRFRVPYGYGVAGVNNPTANPDYVTTNRLALMRFGLNTRNSIQQALNAMRITNGRHRINVGLMWGWFSLSQNWQGLWSASLPGLPAAMSPLVSKQLVLVVTGRNNVYIGLAGQSNDDTSTRLLCEAIRSRGITIYTVGFGAPGSYNQTLLRECASGPTYFHTASSNAQLTTAFERIADAIQRDTLHLSQ